MGKLLPTTGATGATRRSTKLSSKVNLHHAINFRALCGANLITKWSRFRPNEALELLLVGGHFMCKPALFQTVKSMKITARTLHISGEDHLV